MRIVPVEEILQAKPVEDLSSSSLSKLWILAMGMAHTCAEHNGVGLHAVQIGSDINLFVMSRSNPPFVAYPEIYFNCSYEPIGEEKIKSIEGCLSLDTKLLKLDSAGPVPRKRFFEVLRYKKIRVKGKQLVQEAGILIAKDIDIELSENIYCVIMQHEIDHSGNGMGKGILISDIGKEIHIWQ